MFDSLSSKLQSAFKAIRGKTKISESDLKVALQAVRIALLEADVNFKLVKEFCDNIAQKSLGEAVTKSLTPDQQIIKIVHEELVKMMGESAVELNLKVTPPAIIMLVGLQGAGKTTTAGKLAKYLKEKLKRNPLLVPCDVYRPAAIEQLKTLGSRLKIETFKSSSLDPIQISTESCEYARLNGFDTVIIDTAGRLQIDTEMMNELREVSLKVQPHEILLVADAMTGQSAVEVASGFHSALEIDGLILTKLDGDARGGAALSMRQVTNCPIKFIGVGEKSENLEVFHPERMASRILGMGDVLSLIEKASEQISLEDSLKLQKKMKKNEFDFEDFLGQLKMMKSMGSISSLAGMIPGMSQMMKDVDNEKAEKELKRTEAIILSMTKKERQKPSIIDGNRRKRIAKGSGTKVEDINRLMKQFLQMKQMMQKLMGSGLGGMLGKAGMSGLMKRL